MKNIRIQCNNANHICDKNQYMEASLLEKIKLIIHLIYCKACRQYSKKNGQLTKFIKASKSQHVMSKDEKKILHKNLEDQLKQQQ